jgi:beta-lactamase regulating signal transducer with metallopeptidase domain
MKTYADLGADKRRLALGAIFGIWVLGIIAWSIYYSITVGGLLIKLRRTCYKGDGRVERILEEIAPNSGISIRYTDLVDTPFLVGIFKPTIYMTEVECTDTQIKYILTHEYTHWKRKDPWKLLFAYLMIIIFWWNPLFRLLHKDIKLMIEMGCDKTMLRDYPMRYALEYLKTYVMYWKQRNIH